MPDAPTTDDKPDPTPDPKPEPKPDRTDWKTEARKWEERAKENSKAAERLKALEDAGKSETEKLTADRDSHRTRADSAEGLALRYEVALDKGLSKTMAKRLQGSTREELEADADELAEALGSKDRSPARDTPRERLRGGSDPTEDPVETDPRKLAEAVPRQ